MRLGVAAALVDGALVPGDVEVDGDRIAGVGLGGAGRGIAAPGFVDLQVNGFAGVDLMHADREGHARAGAALLATGVTAYLPTFVTAPEPDDPGRAARAAGRAGDPRRAPGGPVPRAPAGSAPIRPSGAATPTRRCWTGCSRAAA